MTDIPANIIALLVAMGDEDGPQYLASLKLPDGRSAALGARTLGFVTIAGLDGATKTDFTNVTVELTQEGKTVLAQHLASAKKSPRKTTQKPKPQEDDMAKNKSEKKVKKAKPTGERTPNAESHRWVAIEAMKANKGATRDEIAAICIKANGGSAAVWAKRIARARRFAKKTGLELGALGKPEKAEKPKKVKADKPKAKKSSKPKVKAAAAEGDDLTA